MKAIAQLIHAALCIFILTMGYLLSGSTGYKRGRRYRRPR